MMNLFLNLLSNISRGFAIFCVLFSFTVKSLPSQAQDKNLELLNRPYDNGSTSAFEPATSRMWRGALLDFIEPTWIIERKNIIPDIGNAQQILTQAKSHNQTPESRVNIMPWIHSDLAPAETVSLQNSETLYNAALVLASSVAHIKNNRNDPKAGEMNFKLYPDLAFVHIFQETYPDSYRRKIKDREHASQAQWGEVIGSITTLAALAIFPGPVGEGLAYISASVTEEFANRMAKTLGPNFSKAGEAIPFDQIRYTSIERMLSLGIQAQLIYDIQNHLLPENSSLHYSIAQKFKHDLQNLLDHHKQEMKIELLILFRQIAGLELANKHNDSMRILTNFVVHQDDFRLLRDAMKDLGNESYQKQLAQAQGLEQSDLFLKETRYGFTMIDTLIQMHDQIAKSPTVQRKTQTAYDDLTSSEAEHRGLSAIEAREILMAEVSNISSQHLLHGFKKRFGSLSVYENFTAEEFDAKTQESQKNWLKPFEDKFIGSKLTGLAIGSTSAGNKAKQTITEAPAKAADIAADAVTHVAGKTLKFTAKACGKALVRMLTK